MKRLSMTMVFCLTLLNIVAQDTQRPFQGYLENKEFDIYLRINFYDKNIQIPGQEYYGEIPGYLGKVNNAFCWVFVDARLKSEKEAELSIVNDYGSEDLTATLTCKGDSLFVLRQDAGSSIKIPRDRKWFKLPKNIEFKRRK